MDKKNNKAGIYAPGELSRVREKLGVTDVEEAKRMAGVLGGEVGTEREIQLDPAKIRRPFRRGETVKEKKSRKAARKVDIAGSGDEAASGRLKAKSSGPFPGDDPAATVRLSYMERVKIDQYAGQMIFEIKSSMQVLSSIFSFFREPVDLVNPRFVTVRMNEYYAKVEKLVTATRNLLPKANSKRNNQLKRTSIFVYKIVETLRSWNIEKLASGIAELQSNPRNVKVTDFTDVLREILVPLFVLDDLNTENIKSAFKLVYKILYIESPMEAKEKYQDVIRNIITSLADVRRNVVFGIYPILMKLISDRFIPYERFFTERRRRYMAFLNVTDTAQLYSADLSPQQIESMDVETLQKNLKEEVPEESEEADDGVPEEGKEEEDPNDPKIIERRAREEAEKMEKKALEQGKTALETLFPKANWDKLDEFPDLYPYFANVYSLKGGYELIAPTDPVQQVAMMMNILDDLFIGLRYINFGTVIGPDGHMVMVSDELGDIINNWRSYIEDSFSKDYLPRLMEYCRMLENSEDARSSQYAKKTMNELHWIKRLYFLPYYKFESLGPPPFPKSDVIPIYSLIRKMRKILTAVAVGIEQGVRAGGAASKATCNGINNPWERYNYQIPNPVSKRLDILLAPEKRINATVVFFTLSAVTVLDNIINNEHSWAYGNRPGPLFRSIKNEGIIPQFGVDDKLDADKIFKDSLKKSAEK
ncbi:MAG: hypothetical protein FWC19_04140 [Treponema sp.]|nr:hypothetical protein [Treponema sp.]